MEVAEDEFMCPPHWKMVPASLRAAIQASYPSDEPAAEFLAISQGAIEAVAHKEARSAPRKESAATTTPQEPSAAPPKTSARRPRRTVQLGLFELGEIQ